MTEAMSAKDTSPHSTVHDMADGVSQAVGTAVRVAGQTKDSITLFRDSIRQAPLMMGFLLMGLGYIVGTITTVRPRQISGR